MYDTIVHTLLNGVGGLDLVMSLAMTVTGLFFALSGYHKLFYPARHQALVDTLRADGVPFVSFFQWFVPVVEFIGGAMLVVQLFVVPISVVLAILLVVACACDGKKRVEEMKPLDIGDQLDDWLYLTEVVYLVLLAVFVAYGPTEASLDVLLVRGWL